MSVQWNPYIQQRGVKFAIRESSFGRGRQNAPVEWAPGSTNSQRVSRNEFNRLLDSANPVPPPPPASLAPWPYPSFGEVPVAPFAPTYVPAGPTPTTAFIPPVLIVPAAGPRIPPSGSIPVQSDFTSGISYSAWWGYREGAINQICATQGRGFIQKLRGLLHVGPGFAWDADVQNALISQVTALAGSNPAAWAGTLLQLRNDLASRSISGLSLLVGIYAAYYAGNNRRMDAIVVYPNTVLPVWDQAPEDDRGLNNGLLVCFDPNIETADAPTGGVAAALAESSTGIRVGASRETTGLSTVVDAPSAGVSVWGFLAAALGIGVVIWAVTPSDEERKNPQLREGSKLARLQQEVMAELHRTRLWAPGIRAREVDRRLVVTGDTSKHKPLSVSLYETRIPGIAAANGFMVNDRDWKLTFEPRMVGYSE